MCIKLRMFTCVLRVLGSLLSAHLIIKDPLQPFGPLRQIDYNDELLQLAHDLGTRLLAAFENTATGIPHPRVGFSDSVLWSYDGPAVRVLIFYCLFLICISFLIW